MVVERYSYGLYGEPDTLPMADVDRSGVMVSMDAWQAHGDAFDAALNYVHPSGLQGDLRADVDGDGMLSSWDQLRFAQQQTAWLLVSMDAMVTGADEYQNGWSTQNTLSRTHPVGQQANGEPLSNVRPSPGTLSPRENYKLRGLVQLDNRLGFAGYVWDPFLKMYHVRHRVLNPRLGIWMQPDPIGYAGGWNLHEYAGGDPLGFVDPTGLDFLGLLPDGSVSGFVTGVGEAAVGLATGAAKGVAELALTAYDAGGNVVEVGVFAVGWDYRHNNLSGTMRSNETGTLGERLGTGIKQAGQTAAAVGTLGASEVALGVIDYAETGDGDALSERMGGVVFQNLTAAAIAKARAAAEPAPPAPAKPSQPVATPGGGTCGQNISGPGYTAPNQQISGPGWTAPNQQLTGPGLVEPSGIPFGTAANPIQGLQRVGSALKTDPYHAFPDVIDNFASSATKTQLKSGASLYQVEGSLNGAAGRFEWIIQDGNVTHRLFVPGGRMNGVPIKP